MVDFRSASISCKLAAIVVSFYVVASMFFAAMSEDFLSVLDWTSEVGLYTSASIDLVVGLVLIRAAPSSRSRVGLNIIGAIALLGAVFYFLMPVDFWAAYFDWWLIEQRTLTRVMSILFGLPIGGFILFAAITNETNGGRA